MPLDQPLGVPLVPHPPRLLEVYEVAHELRCSQETVLRLIRKGKLAAVRLGTRAWRVRRQDLDAFIESQRVGTLEAAIVHGERAIDRALDGVVRTLRPGA